MHGAILKVPVDRKNCRDDPIAVIAIEMLSMNNGRCPSLGGTP